MLLSAVFKPEVPKVGSVNDLGSASLSMWSAKVPSFLPLWRVKV